MKSGLISLLECKPKALAVAAFLGLGSVAEAAIQLNFVYNPATDTTTATYFGSWSVNSAFNPGAPGLESTGLSFYSTAGTVGLTIGGIAGPYPWGSGMGGASVTGDSFGFSPNYNIGPENFTSSTVISGSMTYAVGVDLADLGFDAGEIASGGTLSGTGGTVNWTASVLAVPEPSSFALLAGGLALGAVVARRRRVA